MSIVRIHHGVGHVIVNVEVASRGIHAQVSTLLEEGTLDHRSWKPEEEEIHD